MSFRYMNGGAFRKATPEVVGRLEPDFFARRRSEWRRRRFAARACTARAFADGPEVCLVREDVPFDGELVEVRQSRLSTDRNTRHCASNLPGFFSRDLGFFLDR